MPTVPISGGSGLIGRHLIKILRERKYDVSVLSTTNAQIPGTKSYYWNLEKSEVDREAIETADYVVHLAGANIGSARWSSKRKKEIIDSRIKSSELIFDALQKSGRKINAFISASAIGYYGAVTSAKIFHETDSAAKDFLGQTCLQWESAADNFKNAGIRTVKIRTGIVLTAKGGALSKMMTPVKLGIGAPLGTGKQYMPWIHIDDLCAIYIKAIEDTLMDSSYNAVAPDHKTNGEFTQLLAKELKKTLWLPNIPRFVLRILFGEMANMILEGSRVSSEKIIANGFQFNFATLEKTLNQLLGKYDYH